MEGPFETRPRDPHENPEGERPEGPSPLYRSAWGFYLVVAILGVVWLGGHHGELTLDLFVDLQTWWIDAAIGIGAAATLLFLWWSGRRFVPSMRRLEEEMRSMIGPLDGSEIFALALISGFSEELLFRGAMQASWGWPWALAFFTILHTGPGPAFRYWTLFAFVAGGLFGWITLLRGNLLPAILAHILVNGINLARLLDAPDLDSIEENEESVRLLE